MAIERLETLNYLCLLREQPDQRLPDNFYKAAFHETNRHDKLRLIF